MPQGKIVKDAALRAAAIVLAVLIFSTVPTSGIFAAEMHKGSGGSSSAGETGATSPQIAELMALLADPKVREWLEKQSAAEASHNNKRAPDVETNSVSHYFDTRVGATREHIAALAAAVPDLANQFERAVGLVEAEIPVAGPSCCSFSSLRRRASPSSGCFARRRGRYASALTEPQWRLCTTACVSSLRASPLRSAWS